MCDVAEMELDMVETDAWIEHLLATGRKSSTCRSYRNAVRQCLARLYVDGRPTKAAEITVGDIQYLWQTIPAKSEVRHTYLRNLAGMIVYYTGKDVVKQADLLKNRETRERVFIDKDEFGILYERADPTQRLIAALGAFMGLRRCEMQAIRDGDIVGDRVRIHGKGHCPEGLEAVIRIPEPVMQAIEEYRAWKGPRVSGDDDHLLQSTASRGPAHEMNLSDISTHITRLSRETGIRVTTHAFRRFFATTLYYDTDCDVQTIRKLMRHADVTTTYKCYIDAYEVREREASDKLSDLLCGIIKV